MEHTKRPDVVALVEPVEGWSVMGPYGLQRFGPGPADRLVRLEEVLAWLCLVQEVPAARALTMVFGRLIEWDEADEKHRGFFLYALSDQDYAQPIERDGVVNPDASDAWGELEFAYSGRSAQGLVRDIADLWADSWPGYLVDADKFYQKGWVEYCKRMKQTAKSYYGEHIWHAEYTKRYYMDLAAWKLRCECTMKTMRQLCVPLHVAHQLWGWGTVAQASKAAALVPSQVQTFAELVAYRQLGESLPATNRPLWVASHVELLASELRRRKAASVGRGFKAEIARELGFTGGNPGAALNPILTRFGFTIDGERIPGAAVAADMACRLVGNS